MPQLACRSPALLLCTSNITHFSLIPLPSPFSSLTFTGLPGPSQSSLSAALLPLSTASATHQLSPIHSFGHVPISELIIPMNESTPCPIWPGIFIFPLIGIHSAKYPHLPFRTSVLLFLLHTGPTDKPAGSKWKHFPHKASQGPCSMSLVFSAPLSTSPLAFLAQLSPIHCQEPLTHMLATVATASTATCTGWELSKHLEHKSVCKLPPPPPQPPGFWELKSQKALTSYLLPRLPLKYKEKCPQSNFKKPPGTTKPGKHFPRESLLKGSLMSQDFLSRWWVYTCFRCWNVGKPDTRVTTQHRAGQAQRWYYLHGLYRNIFFSSQPALRGGVPFHTTFGQQNVYALLSIHWTKAEEAKCTQSADSLLCCRKRSTASLQQVATTTQPCTERLKREGPTWEAHRPSEPCLLASSSNDCLSQPDLHVPTAYSSWYAHGVALVQLGKTPCILSLS